jgi:hypothetical protein
MTVAHSDFTVQSIETNFGIIAKLGDLFVDRLLVVVPI